jgi:opacity protein-like surface antigen
VQKQIKKFSFLLLAVLFVLLLLPAKSADAAVSTLLYGEFIGSTIDIHRIESDGTGDTNLTNGGSDELRGFSGLEWSPDGTKIAYVLSNPGGTQYNVHVMNADGSNDTALTTDNISGLHGGVKWSPDGTKLVFVTN